MLAPRPCQHKTWRSSTGVLAALLEIGTPAQVDRWVPRFLSGEQMGFLAFTEPQTGSDARALTTRAERVPEGWRISGRKLWISNTRTAHIGIVFARDPSDEVN